MPRTSARPGDPVTADSVAFELNVTLRDIAPPIWRRLRVPTSLTLAQLHDVLQIAFGWEDAHLHQFMVGRAIYGRTGLEMAEPSLIDERTVRIADVARPGSTLVYIYDFGDDWLHDIQVERGLRDSDGPPLACLDGERSAPPEDSGGPPAYPQLLQALAKPKSGAHDETREWLGDWKPDAFRIDAVNDELRKLEARWKKGRGLRLVAPPRER